MEIKTLPEQTLKKTVDNLSLGSVRKSLLAKALRQIESQPDLLVKTNKNCEDLSSLQENFKIKSVDMQTKLNTIEVRLAQKLPVKSAPYKLKPSTKIDLISTKKCEDFDLSPVSNKRYPQSTRNSSPSQSSPISNHKRNRTLPKFQSFSTLPKPFDSPYSSSRRSLSPDLRVEKPVSLIILEKYFSDVCKSIANTTMITKELLIKAKQMKIVLNDCLNSMPDLSLNFYVLMESSLNDIFKISSSQNPSNYRTLANKLLQLAEYLEQNSFRNPQEPASPRKTIDNPPKKTESLPQATTELKMKIARITPKLIDI